MEAPTRLKADESKRPNFLVITARRYNDANGSMLAKGLSFNLVVGLLPLFFLSISATALIFESAPGLTELLTNEFLYFLPENTVSSIIRQIDSFAGRWEAFSAFTIAIFLITAFYLFEALERAVTTMLAAERRSFRYGRLVSLGLMLGSFLFFYVASVVSVASKLLLRYGIVTGSLFSVWTRAASILMFTLMFVFLFKVFARQKLRFFPLFSVSLIGAVVWQVVGHVGSILIRLASRRFIIYGAMAGAVIFLIFMRILAEIIVVASLVIRYWAADDRT